jgi:integrase
MSLYREKLPDGTFKTGIWMFKVYVHGQPIRRSTGTTNEKKAQKIEAAAKTDIDRGAPTAAAIGKLRWTQAADGILADYGNNEYDTLEDLQGRLDNHLTPFFGKRTRMTAIGTVQINAYIKTRREADAANGTINRELAVLKRMFTLAVQAGQLLYRPYIPMLKERNVRKGFFEYEQFLAVRRQLPVALQGVATVAYITGWRVDSEILPQEWARHVDFAGNELHLEADEAKGEEPRTFPLTGELRAVYEAQDRARQALTERGQICPWVFFRMVAKGRRGLSSKHAAHAAIVPAPKAIKRFDKAWATACVAAGCPGMLRHDFRRTAIRNMVRLGIPERVAMQLCGHKTRSVFDRYNIVSPADLQAARTRLEDVAGGGVNPLTGSKTGSMADLTSPAASRSAKTLRKFGGAARI